MTFITILADESYSRYALYTLQFFGLYSIPQQPFYLHACVSRVVVRLFTIKYNLSVVLK